MGGTHDSKCQLRCLNCFERFTPAEVGVESATCPHCGMEWRITWSSPDFVKVRGPVWNKQNPD